MFIFCQAKINSYCSSRKDILHQYWNNLNGDATIESLALNWTQWDIKDALKWFKYILSCKYIIGNNGANCDEKTDYDSGNDSNSDSDSESDNDHDRDKVNIDIIL